MQLNPLLVKLTNRWSRLFVIVILILLAGRSLTMADPKKKFVDNIPADVTVLSNLEYVPGGGQWQSLDLYLPKTTGGPLPLVVFIHGGGWCAFTKDDWHPSFHDLLTHGFAVANINYRLTPGSIFPAQIYDAKAAVRWLRSHAADYHLDPNHVGVWGHSAGGHLSALMGVSNGVAALEGTEGVTGVSSDVQAACDWSGPTELVKTYENGRDANALLWDVVVKLVGGPDKVNKDLLAQASPITYVNSNAVPLLIMQGVNDDVVPLFHSNDFGNALKKVGVESTVIIIPGEGHGICKPDDVAQVTAFFEKHLKPAP